MIIQDSGSWSDGGVEENTSNDTVAVLYLIIKRRRYRDTEMAVRGIVFLVIIYQVREE